MVIIQNTGILKRKWNKKILPHFIAKTRFYKDYLIVNGIYILIYIEMLIHNCYYRIFRKIALAQWLLDEQISAMKCSHIQCTVS